MGERAFSLYDVEQFIREAGAERVTEDAVLHLEKELEKLTEALAGRAKRYAEHAGRSRLIKKSDITLAKPVARYSRPYALRSSAKTTNAASTKQR